MLGEYKKIYLILILANKPLELINCIYRINGCIGVWRWGNGAGDLVGVRGREFFGINI